MNEEQLELATEALGDATERIMQLAREAFETHRDIIIQEFGEDSVGFLCLQEGPYVITISDTRIYK